jgi:hypothetical protein
MPFINGRYHVNPAMGQALEAAREAEAALLALQRQARKNSADASATAPADDSADPDDPSSANADAEDAQAGAGPIHHVEIETTEFVPSNSGRATRGFVARVHRAPAAADARSAADPWQSAARSASPPETHIFSDHGDLVNFLRDALAKDSAQR